MPYPTGFCYAYPSPVFQRAMRLIDSITNAPQAIVTTTFAHNYETGDIVRFDIPFLCGMQQINQMTGTIVVTGATTFSVDINSTNFDTFSIPGSPLPTDNICAQVVPVGEVNSKLTSATQNVLPI